MGTPMNITFKEIDNQPNGKIIELDGDLDATNVESALEQITSLMNEGVVKIIADFTKLSYVNSTGLGILLHFSKMAKEKDGCFKITNVNEHVYEIIEIIGANTLLEIYDNVEEAAETLK